MRLLLVLILAVIAGCSDSKSADRVAREKAELAKQKEAAYIKAVEEYENQQKELARLDEELKKEQAPFTQELTKVQNIIMELNGNLRRMKQMRLEKRNQSTKELLKEWETKRDEIIARRDKQTVEITEKIKKQKAVVAAARDARDKAR